MADETKTNINLQVALAGEADANRRYTAFGIRALQEGRPEVAQLFFEAAGAEAVHAYSLLSALGAIGSTAENLRAAALGETGEIEQRYPRMIAEAEAEGNPQALAAFRLALEREKRHQDTFRRALVLLESPASGQLPRSVPSPTDASATAVPQTPNGSTQATPKVDRATTKRILEQLESERARIARLAGIREVVFGGQDGLISTTTLVAGIAATTTQNVVVLVAGVIAAAAGALSMVVGSYLASRAQRQLYESELASEQQEIAEKPGEEMAELLAALIGRGMSRRDAIDVARRVATHPKIMMDLLGSFELGLVPGGLGSPVRDALVTGLAFVAGSVIPLVPFFLFTVKSGLIVTMLFALISLFALGVVKARLSGRPLLASGAEVVGFGGAAGLLGYALGRVVSVWWGISI
ncbi:MAG: VIT1/CCC1 transporter family protein [Deltaproteobacteria bacterium]|nr:VIT1/CCC1 transporter family protein [Deltaproteobacteria bacterium]